MLSADCRVLFLKESDQPSENRYDMKDFRNLQVWHKAYEVTLATYRATAAFPKEEIYGLTS
jgi:23S rRNA-intervening sequence protein